MVFWIHDFRTERLFISKWITAKSQEGGKKWSWLIHVSLLLFCAVVRSKQPPIPIPIFISSLHLLTSPVCSAILYELVTTGHNICSGRNLRNIESLWFVRWGEGRWIRKEMEREEGRKKGRMKGMRRKRQQRVRLMNEKKCPLLQSFRLMAFHLLLGTCSSYWCKANLQVSNRISWIGEKQPWLWNQE